MDNRYSLNMAGRPKSKPAGPVSSAVAELRTAAGMTQQGLAHFLGVGVPTVGRWETVRVPDKKFLKELLGMAINMERPELGEVFRLALVENTGLDALMSMPQISGHLAHAQSHLAYLTTAFEEFRKEPLTEAETMQIADEVMRCLGRARRLAAVLDINSPHFGKTLDVTDIADVLNVQTDGSMIK